jgi:putative transposase
LTKTLSVMPFVKIYIHFVWSTKNRTPFLNSPDLRKEVWKHIKEKSVEKKIFIDCINGYAEHCHCLISLGINQTINKIMQLLKGESSFWINKQKLCRQKFEWQDEYFAVSVSESNIPEVRRYILKQEQHHTRKSFHDELDDFIEKWGFQKFKDGSIELRDFGHELPPSDDNQFSPV